MTECSGVEPNPRLSLVLRGAETARRESCDVVIGMGGGNTMRRRRLPQPFSMRAIRGT